MQRSARRVKFQDPQEHGVYAYRALLVSPLADAETIERVFQGFLAAEDAGLTDGFGPEVRRAYDILSNPLTRDKYDAKISIQLRMLEANSRQRQRIIAHLGRDLAHARDELNIHIHRYAAASSFRSEKERELSSKLIEPLPSRPDRPLATREYAAVVAATCRRDLADQAWQDLVEISVAADEEVWAQGRVEDVHKVVRDLRARMQRIQHELSANETRLAKVRQEYNPHWRADLSDVGINAAHDGRLLGLVGAVELLISLVVDGQYVM